MEELFDGGSQAQPQPSSDSDYELTQYLDKREFFIPNIWC